MNEARSGRCVSEPNAVQQNGRDTWAHTVKACSDASVKQGWGRERTHNAHIQTCACLQGIPGRAGSTRWRLSHRSQLAREYAFQFLGAYGFLRDRKGWHQALRIYLLKPINDIFRPAERRSDRSTRFMLTISRFVGRREAINSPAFLRIKTLSFFLLLTALGLPTEGPPTSNSVIRAREVSSQAPLPYEVRTYRPLAPLAPPLS